MRSSLNRSDREFEIDWVIHSVANVPPDNALALGFPQDAQFDRKLPGHEAAGEAFTTMDDGSAIVVIESRAFLRECLSRCLKVATSNEVLSFASVEALLASTNIPSISFVVLVADDNAQGAELRRQLASLGQLAGRAPIVVLSNVEEPDAVLNALNSGAKGYIPTSAPLDVAIEAMRLVKAGGVYVPASSLFAMRQSKTHAQASENRANHSVFTARQRSVVEALRRGKANKIIAHELQMRESTVKVHVRNIMKKLKAKNRTEVAFLANGMLESDLA